MICARVRGINNSVYHPPALFCGWWGSADGNPARISSIGKCDISTENERGESVDFILWRKAHLSTREFIGRNYLLHQFFLILFVQNGRWWRVAPELG